MKKIEKFLLAMVMIIGIITPTALVAAEDSDILLNVDFDEGDAKDKSIYQTHGTIVGNVEFVEGVGGGKAARIVNADKGSGDNTEAVQYIDFGTPDNLKLTTSDFSVSFWMKSDDYAGDGQALVSNKNYSSGANVGFTYGMFSNSNRLNFTSQGGGRKDIYNIPAADALKNGWKKVDLVVNRAEQAEIYIDGVHYSSLDAKGGTIDTGLPFVIGASGVYKNGAVDATIDNLIIRKGLLDKATILSSYLTDEIHYHKYQFEKIIDEYSGIESVATLVTQLQARIDELNSFTSIVNDNNAKELIANKIMELQAIKQEILEMVPNAPDKNQVLYMDFEDDVKDKSGNNNHGTIVNKSENGVVEFVQGAVGKGLHIKSSNGIGSKNATEYIDIEESASLKFADNNFSVAMWVKFEEDFNSGLAGNSSAVIGNKDWTSGANPGFVIGAFGNGMLANFGTKESGRFETARSRDVYNNQWNFVVVNVDRKNTKKMSVYTNNVLTSEKDISNALGSIDVNGLHWVIGADAIHKEGMSEMYLDELRIFNTVLDEQKMSSLYNELSPKTVFNEEIETAKTVISEAKKNETHTKKRITEFEKGIAYLEEELSKDENIDIGRLRRDLNNMYDRFAQKSEPIMSFNTITDTHIDRGQKEPANLDNYYQDIRFLNPDSTAVMNSGDFTDGAKESEYKTHYEVLEKNKTDGREDITALGNHDVRWLCSPNNPESGTNRTTPTCPIGHPNANLFADRYLKYNTPYMESEDWDGESLYYNKWINGYNFVVINTEKDLKDWAYISEDQLTWLDKTLAKDADPNKPIFIALHQTLKDTAYYEEGDIVGEQDEALKEVLRKYPQAVVFTGHIHSTVDRAALYYGDWGHQYDMASFSYAYTSGGDRRNQIAYQIDVFEDQVEIKVRDHATGKWLDEYTQVFSVTDPLPADPNDASKDLAKKHFEATAGSSQNNEGVENLFDDNPNTIWHTDWSESNRDKFFLDFKLDKPTEIDGIRYMARSNAGNGTILEADVLISTDNGLSYTKHSTINFKQRTGWQLANFPKVTVTNMKLQITKSVGTYASGSGIRITTPADKPDTTKLEQLVNEVKDKDVSTYTTTSANAFKKALADAKTALDATTQKAVDDAYSALDKANKALSAKADTTNLDALIKTIEEIDLTLYTTASAKDVSDALAEAKAIDKDDASQSAVDAAHAKLLKAQNDLVKKVDKEKLTKLIEEAKAIDTSGYSETSVKTFTDALKDAEKALAEATTQKAIDDAYDVLDSAIKGLQEKVVSTTRLNELLTQAKAIDVSKYTDESVAPLQEAIAEAEALLLKRAPATQEEVDAVATKLDAAIKGLVLKAPGTLDKDKLTGLVADAEKINKNMYTKESVAVFEAALAKVKLQLANATTQEEIEAAYSELTAAIAQLKVKEGASNSTQSGAPSTGDVNSTLPYLVLLGGASVFIFRRRENIRKLFNR